MNNFENLTVEEIEKMLEAAKAKRKAEEERLKEEKRKAEEAKEAQRKLDKNKEYFEIRKEELKLIDMIKAYDAKYRCSYISESVREELDKAFNELKNRNDWIKKG